MFNISLIEFQVKKEPVERKNIPSNSFSLMTNRLITSSVNVLKNNIKNVSNDFVSGIYKLSSKYTIIFLYDYLNDKTSKEFIEKYGGDLHTISSINMSILTYFTNETVEKWNNVQNKELIGTCDDDHYSIVHNTINALKENYEVQKLPAIIIVKKEIDENGNECDNSFKMEIPRNSSDELFKLFKIVIDTINSNCNEDFDYLCSKLTGSNSTVFVKNALCKITFGNYIQSLCFEYKKAHKIKYNLDELAIDLGISTKGLYNKRTDCTFTREECIYMAIKFQLDSNALDNMLCLNGRELLKMNGRDLIIRKALSNKFSIEDTNRELEKNNLDVILSERE